LNGLSSSAPRDPASKPAVNVGAPSAPITSPSRPTSCAESSISATAMSTSGTLRTRSSRAAGIGFDSVNPWLVSTSKACFAETTASEDEYDAVSSSSAAFRIVSVMT
jgi:hypothetical protein